VSRRKHEEEHENHERWLVSYADFITLLFAFFVVMYAISSINTGKYRVLSDSLGSAFGREAPQVPPTRAQIELGLNGLKPLAVLRREAAVRRDSAQLATVSRNLQQTLSPLIAQGKVQVTQSSRGINVTINSSVLFATGEARLTNDAKDILKSVAQTLKDDRHAIQVEGHTDNVPINTPQFASNWELSSARAGSVVRLFAENGVGEARMLAIGHSATQPIDSNDTTEGKAHNRRVEVMILASVPPPVPN
jgi:chemotaxis protein MotB